MNLTMIPFGSISEWANLFTALGTLGSAFGLGAAVKLGFAWWRRRQARGTVDEIQLGYQICVELDTVRENLGGARALIVRAHNGGKDINPDYS